MTVDMNALILASRQQIHADAEQLQMPVAQGAPSLGDAGASSFSDAMAQAVRGVNAQDSAAGQKMADVDAGRSDDLVGAMLASQEASLSFSMLMQVRNKVMGAMDELIKLPL